MGVLLAASPALAQASFVEVYRAPSTAREDLVALVHVREVGGSDALFATSLHRLLRSWPAIEPVDRAAEDLRLVPTPPPTQHWVTSAGGRQIAAVRPAFAGGPVETTAELLDPAAPTPSVPGPLGAAFTLSEDGSTLLAAYVDPENPAAHRVAIRDPRTAAQRAGVTRSGISHLRVSADGERFAWSDGRGIDVHMAKGPDAGVLLAQLPPADDFRLSADGRIAALFRAGGVTFHEEGTASFTLPTHHHPLDAAFGPGPRAAVVDREHLYLYDLTAGALVFERSLGVPGGVFTNVDVGVSPSGRLRVAAGILKVVERPRRVQPNGSASAAVVVYEAGGTALVDPTDPPDFTTRRWRSDSPTVRFLDGVERVLAFTRDSVQVLEGLP